MVMPPDENDELPSPLDTTTAARSAGTSCLAVPCATTPRGAPEPESVTPAALIDPPAALVGFALELQPAATASPTITPTSARTRTVPPPPAARPGDRIH